MGLCILSIIVLGPQASSPARVQQNPDRTQLMITEMMYLGESLSTRAGGDACGPRTMIRLFHARETFAIYKLSNIPYQTKREATYGGCSLYELRRKESR